MSASHIKNESGVSVSTNTIPRGITETCKLDFVDVRNLAI